MSDSSANIRNKKDILLIVSDTINISTIVASLENFGYTAAVTFSFDEAVEQRKKDSEYRLILIDILLLQEKVSITTATDFINDLSAPVLILADSIDDNTIKNVEKLNPSGYIPKEADTGFINASISNVLRMYSNFNAEKENNRSDAQCKHERAFMDYMHDVFCCCTPDVTIKYISPSAENLMGYTVAELTGQSAYTVIWHDDIDNVVNKVGEAVSKQEDHYRVEHRMLHKDGHEIWVETQGRLFYDNKGELVEIHCVVRDITKRRNMEIQKDNALEALRQSEETFRGIAEQLRDSIFITDSIGTITYLSPASRVLFGYAPDEMMGHHFMEYLDESSVPVAMERFTSTIDTGDPQKSILLNMKRRDGSLFQGELVADILFKNNEPIGTLGLIRDTTERKEAEEALAAALEEKESLLKELQHRVKNSFAIVAGMVELESNRHNDKAVHNVLVEIRNRVSSMAYLYDILCDSEEVQEIQLDHYLERMTNSIMDSYLSGQGNVELQLSMDAIRIDVKRAISLGLIVNEIITNAAKYAFPHGRSGIIKLNLEKTNGGFMLEISDNGIGLPHDFSIDEPPGLGIELVRMLTMQLDGTLGYVNDNGGLFRITIPGIGQ